MISGAIAILLAFVLLAYCIWTLDRAFDLTDESYYLLLAIHPDAVKAYNSAQHWVTSGLWQISGTLQGFRLVGLGVLLLSATILALGALSLVSNRSRDSSVGGINRYAVIASTWIASMLYGATINFSPCYNLLAAVGAYAGLGFAFLAVSHPPRRQFRYIFYILCGIALAIEFVSKASAGVATLALTLLFVSLCEADIRARLLGIFSIIFGLMSAVVILLLANTTFVEFYQAFQLGMIMFRQVQTEPVLSRIVRYAGDIGGGILSTVRVFFVPLLLALLSSVYKSLFFALSSISALLFVLLFGGYFLGGVGQYYQIASAAFFLVSVSILYARLSVALGLRFRLGLVVLFVLPYSVAFGTGNSLFTQIIASLASWGTLVSIYTVFGARRNSDKLYLSVLWLTFLAAIVFQTVSSGFRGPYNANSPVAEQSREANVAAFGRVKVEEGMVQFIDSMNDAVRRCKIEPGRPFLGLYNNPGVALVINGKPPVSPWLNNTDQANKVTDMLDSDTFSRAIIGLHVNQQGEYLPLPKRLTNFPAGYIFCGSAIYPWQNRIYQIWMPKS